MTSRSAPALNADGTWSTLGQVLSALMPNLDFKANVEGESLPDALKADQMSIDHTVTAPVAVLDPFNLETPLAAQQLAGDPLTIDPEVTVTSEMTEQDSQRPHIHGEGDVGHQNDATPLEQLSSSQPQTSSSGAPPAGSSGVLLVRTPIAGLQGGGAFKALVSGIVPPLEAPIAWLHAELHAPDYFLYIIITPC